MAERFEKLFSLQENLYSQDAPLVVSAGALLKDTETDRIIVQLKYHSLSQNTIVALKIGIKAFDVEGKEVEGVNEYQYLDLNVSIGQDFGSNKAIVMPRAITRSFSISSIVVITADCVAKEISLPLAPLPRSETLYSVLQNTELVKQYQIETSTYATFAPQDYKALWCCSCGEWNIHTHCTKCHISKEQSYKLLDRAFLEAETNKRLIAETKRQEETQKQRTIQRKKVKKGALIIIPILFVMLFFCLSFNLDYFNNICAVSAGGNHSAGLKNDGTVVAIGYDDNGECNVIKWNNIVAISASNGHTVGLKSDGSVVATGLNEYGECNVDAWKDIVAISSGGSFTVGLKSDGTVVATGANGPEGRCDVDNWNEIVAISAGEYHTVGLKKDGTVVAVGSTSYGECDVDNWRDIIAIAAGGTHTVGLKEDGTVVAVGENFCGQCEVNEWDNIVAITAGSYFTVGLKKDGTVVTVGLDNKDHNQINGWTNIVAISANNHILGLRKDGTVVAVGTNGDGQCNVGRWTPLFWFVERWK